MCGINGFNWPDSELLTKTTAVLSHRGPDGTGMFTEKGISLGHNRLAIIDTSDKARQPMESASGRFVIVYNGELYNYKELRKELRRYKYRSDSDTEVILAAFEKWGVQCLSRLNGMFAFAIWDRNEGKLILARDPVGIKPLYYYWDGEKLIFASELKAVIAHDIPRRIDEAAFNHYLRVSYVPEPLTMYQGIYKLSPGHFLELRGSHITVDTYVSPEPTSAGEDAVTATNVRQTIVGAVDRQLVSDRPLGVYLSGGIDSSVVTAAMKQLRSRIDTFSVGFTLDAREEAEKFNADVALAAETARHFRTAHHELFVSSDDVLEAMAQTIYHLDQPIGNATALPMFLLSKFVKPTATVVLAGDGGDELFAGYPRHRLSLASDYYQRLHPVLQTLALLVPKARKLGTAPGVDRYAQFHFVKDATLTRVVAPDVFRRKITKRFFEERVYSHLAGTGTEMLLLADEETWLVDESLARADTMSMAHGVEVRVPLLDLEVRRLAHRIPLSRKVSLRGGKKILKEAFADELPRAILRAPKRGWFSPGAKWLRHPAFRALADEVFSPEYHPATAALFNWNEIKAMKREHEEKRAYHYTTLWSILVFQIWAKQFGLEL